MLANGQLYLDRILISQVNFQQRSQGFRQDYLYFTSIFKTLVLKVLLEFQNKPFLGHSLPVMLGQYVEINNPFSAHNLPL